MLQHTLLDILRAFSTLCILNVFKISSASVFILYFSYSILGEGGVWRGGQGEGEEEKQELCLRI